MRDPQRQMNRSGGVRVPQASQHREATGHLSDSPTRCGVKLIVSKLERVDEDGANR